MRLSGAGVALADRRAGTSQVMFPQLPAVLGLAAAGDVRSAGGDQQLSVAAAAGRVAEFQVASWNVILAPKGLPDDVRATLSDAIVAAVKDPELQEKMRKLGVEPVGMASAEADTFFSQELQRWKQVIDDAGIKLER